MRLVVAEHQRPVRAVGDAARAATTAATRGQRLACARRLRGRRWGWAALCLRALRHGGASVSRSACVSAAQRRVTAVRGDRARRRRRRSRRRARATSATWLSRARAFRSAARRRCVEHVGLGGQHRQVGAEAGAVALQREVVGATRRRPAPRACSRCWRSIELQRADLVGHVAHRVEHARRCSSRPRRRGRRSCRAGWRAGGRRRRSAGGSPGRRRTARCRCRAAGPGRAWTGRRRR